MDRVQQLIHHFQLQPHPEGGFYSETYRSKDSLEKRQLPARFAGERSFSTAIYFLVPGGQFSAFHRIESDELWHHYEGDAIEIFVIDQDAHLNRMVLGKDFVNGETFQALVPAGCWFASRCVNEAGYSFVGCTVAPGFSFDGFELARREELISTYPQHTAIITAFSRQEAKQV